MSYYEIEHEVKSEICRRNYRDLLRRVEKLEAAQADNAEVAFQADGQATMWIDQCRRLHVFQHNDGRGEISIWNSCDDRAVASNVTIPLTPRHVRAIVKALTDFVS